MFWTNSIFHIYTLTSYGSGSYNVSGSWQTGSATISSITASIQPATYQQLMRLPEGDRQKSWLAIFSPNALSPGNAETGIQPDSVTYNSASYEIHQSKYFDSAIIHYEALAVKKQF